MENLIIEGAKWLQEDKHNNPKGTIKKRTFYVLSCFKDYLKNNKVEVESSTGKSINEIIAIVSNAQTIFSTILDYYLKGLHFIAVQTFKTYIADLAINHEAIGIRLYKARKPESYYPFTNDEMFHIPYDKRKKVGNQRFSISGLPCLYLGSSTYVCWEEMERNDFTYCNFCGFTNNKIMDVYDLSLPLMISNLEDIKRICIILACSLSAKREELFKVEYVLPQCLLQALLLRHHFYHRDKKLFGIKYISSHALNGDADCFKIDFGDNNWVKRFINYVFPASSAEESGFNSELKALFKQTATTTLFNENLLTPNKIVSGNSHDRYLDSQFGLMDAYLDEKMGFNPLRKEIRIITD